MIYDLEDILIWNECEFNFNNWKNRNQTLFISFTLYQITSIFGQISNFHFPEFKFIDLCWICFYRLNLAAFTFKKFQKHIFSLFIFWYPDLCSQILCLYTFLHKISFHLYLSVQNTFSHVTRIHGLSWFDFLLSYQIMKTRIT